MGPTHTNRTVYNTGPITAHEVSAATNACAEWLVRKYDYTLTNLSQFAYLAEESAAAFTRKGMPFPHVFALLDGKLYERAKPVDGGMENMSYNWHKDACTGPQNCKIP